MKKNELLCNDSEKVSLEQLITECSLEYDSHKIKRILDYSIDTFTIKQLNLLALILVDKPHQESLDFLISAVRKFPSCDYDISTIIYALQEINLIGYELFFVDLFVDEKWNYLTLQELYVIVNTLKSQDCNVLKKCLKHLRKGQRLIRKNDYRDYGTYVDKKGMYIELIFNIKSDICEIENKSRS